MTKSGVYAIWTGISFWKICNRTVITDDIVKGLLSNCDNWNGWKARLSRKLIHFQLSSIRKIQNRVLSSTLACYTARYCNVQAGTNSLPPCQGSPETAAREFQRHGGGSSGSAAFSARSLRSFPARSAALRAGFSRGHSVPNDRGGAFPCWWET